MSRGGTPASYLDKSRRALAGARLLMDGGDPEGACSRAYYAMFDAAHAALMMLAANGAQVSPKTHHGLIGAFGRLVQAGHVDAELGRSLNQVQHMRQLADYIGDPVQHSDAAWAVTQAEAFVAAIMAKLSASQP